MPAPGLLGLRFVCGLFALAVGAPLVQDLLWQRGCFAADAGGRIEASMVGWVVACVGVAAFAGWQPSGLPLRPARPWRTLGLYAALALPWWALFVAYARGLAAAGMPAVAQPQLLYLAGADFGRPMTWLFVAGVAIAAPIAEEVVFRGYLLPALRPALGPTGAVAATAAAFGFVHPLPLALPAALLGAGFGWLAQRAGSLLPAIVAHAAHNAVTVVVTVAWPATLDYLYPR
ncbi:MAG: CPBP family intramembrane metalloprotease [Planctomycetes bacterium]|nr:CPBP family intramembrane metalloprotease [Planctomycetota bacterium]